MFFGQVGGESILYLILLNGCLTMTVSHTEKSNQIFAGQDPAGGESQFPFEGL
jgi:hypothetical protein